MIKNMNNYPPIYAILDYETCKKKNIKLNDFAKGYFNGGGKILQYRDKVNRIETIKENANFLNNLCIDYNGLFIINDYVNLALNLEASLHLGQTDRMLEKDYKGFWGRSTHSIKEVKKVLIEKPLPSYIALGAMFKSLTKPEIKNSKNLIEEAQKLWKKEIVLIGGIHIENISKLPRKKNIYYAIISDFFRYGNLPQNIEKYTKEIINIIN
ncbi:MAG: thiamine phosphate synthase [Spirochaetia bacterium]|nr:thiamine phosphate synthase [Spirochaetia bacterium]